MTEEDKEELQEDFVPSVDFTIALERAGEFSYKYNLIYSVITSLSILPRLVARISVTH